MNIKNLFLPFLLLYSGNQLYSMEQQQTLIRRCRIEIHDNQDNPVLTMYKDIEITPSDTRSTFKKKILKTLTKNHLALIEDEGFNSKKLSVSKIEAYLNIERDYEKPVDPQERYRNKKSKELLFDYAKGFLAFRIIIKAPTIE